MLICEILIVLVLFDVAAGIEISSDRQSAEWTPRYWVQLMAAAGAVVYGLFALWANRELVEDLALGLPPLVVFLILLLPASVVLMTYAATFALGYWSYRQTSSRPSGREDSGQSGPQSAHAPKRPTSWGARGRC